MFLDGLEYVGITPGSLLDPSDAVMTFLPSFSMLSLDKRFNLAMMSLSTPLFVLFRCDSTLKSSEKILKNWMFRQTKFMGDFPVFDCMRDMGMA